MAFTTARSHTLARSAAIGDHGAPGTWEGENVDRLVGAPGQSEAEKRGGRIRLGWWVAAAAVAMLMLLLPWWAAFG